MRGLSAPKDTPAEIVETLSRRLNASFAYPGIKIQLADLGDVPVVMSSCGIRQIYRR